MGYQHRAIRLVNATPFRFAVTRQQRPTSDATSTYFSPAVRRQVILAPGQPGAQGISVDLQAWVKPPIAR